MACLPPAPAPAASAVGDLPRLEPIYSQEALGAHGAPAVRGRLEGTCDGAVRVEAGSANQARPLASVTVPRLGAFVLFVPKDVSLTLRWGCDADGDGMIAAAHVSSAPIGQLAADTPLDLFFPDPAQAGRHTLTVAESGKGPRGRPGSGGGAPTAGMPPPDAKAPADAAVGPPLPDGPPADFDPSTTSNPAGPPK